MGLGTVVQVFGGQDIGAAKSESTLTLTAEVPYDQAIMKGFEDSENPGRLEGIEPLVIEEGISSIGSYAFIGNNLEAVKIPESVSNIQNVAFSDNKLTTVEI